MIEPENDIPLDDSDDTDREDQLSQQDIHSNGLDEERTPRAEGNEPSTDLLNQAFNAAESSYTLNLGDDTPPKKKTEE
ncbi:MAG TPA: hypothetical protein VJ844_00500 [Mucilaginibacter sp.]|nr:hypothetical protein [Mucilaginibacter sp.]